MYLVCNIISINMCVYIDMYISMYILVCIEYVYVYLYLNYVRLLCLSFMVNYWREMCGSHNLDKNFFITIIIIFAYFSVI